MAYEIKVPPVGESVSEGTIAQWLKADGEFVKKGENLVVLDTEKASQDLQAEFTGKLKILVPAGKDVKIGAVIGSIEDSADAGASTAKPEVPAQVTMAPPAPQPVSKAVHVAAPQPQAGTMQP